MTKRSHDDRGVSQLSRYYLGIDGGQSSTTALIADEAGGVVGVGRSGPCNHVSGPEARAKFLAVIGECLDQATRNTSFKQGDFAAACLGFSGGADDKVAYSREIIHSKLLKVTHDAEIALSGATEGEPGIVIIAGTGSMAFGRNAEGRTARAGGWGYLIGDEGGAFDIARRALRAALASEEGWGPATSLHRELLNRTTAASANELLHHWYATVARDKIATLAPIVTDCAQAGDNVAERILIDAANALCWYVQGVYHNLFRTKEQVPIVHIGGVFQSVTLHRAFTQHIRETTGCETTKPRLSPAAGAVIEALRLDGNHAKLANIPQIKT